MSNEILFWVLMTIGVIIALITGAVTVHINEKKLRNDIEEYYYDLIRELKFQHEQDRQKIAHLETKIDFYERDKDEC